MPPLLITYSGFVVDFAARMEENAINSWHEICHFKAADKEQVWSHPTPIWPSFSWNCIQIHGTKHANNTLIYKCVVYFENGHNRSVQEATPTARWPIPELLPIPMRFILFLNFSPLLLWFPIFAFPSNFRSFGTLVFSDTRCLRKLGSFTFPPLSFLPVTPVLVRASGLCLLFLVGEEVSRASETFVGGWSVLSEGSGWLVVFTNSLAERAWSFPALESNCGLAAAPLAGLVDLCRASAGLVLDNEAWDRSTKGWL